MAQAVIRARTDLDASGFNKGISAMEKSVERLKNMTKAAFGAGMIISMAKGALDLGDRIADMADNMGITTSELQTLEYGFRNAGSEADAIVGIMFRLKQAMAAAAVEGEKSKAFEPFEKLGVTIEEVSDLDPAKVLEKMSKAWVDSGKDAATTAALYDLAGKSGRKAMGALSELGKEGLSGWFEAGKSNILSVEEIQYLGKSADDAANKVDLLKKTIAEAAGLGLAAVRGVPDALLKDPEYREKMMKQMKDSGLLPSNVAISTTLKPNQSQIDKEARERVAAEKDVADAKEIVAETELMVRDAKFDQLKDAEKITELARREAEYRGQIFDYLAGNETTRAQAEQDAERARIQREQIERDLAETESQKTEKREKERTFDSLTRIGANALGGANSVPSLLKSALKAQQETAANTKSLLSKSTTF